MMVLFGRRYGVSRDDDKNAHDTWHENLHFVDHFRTEVPVKYIKNATLVPFAVTGERCGNNNGKFKASGNFKPALVSYSPRP